MAAHSERTPLLAAPDSGKPSPPSSPSSSPLDSKSAPVPRPNHGTIDTVETAGVDTSEEKINYAILLPIVGCAWVVNFFAALDGVVIVTLTSAIAGSFGSFQISSWLGSTYYVATSVSQPLAGKLTDIFGRRAGLLLYASLFLIGTLLCGIAPSVGILLAGRVIAGLGSGGIGSIGMFIIGDLVPLRSRGVWSGYANIVYGTGSTLGAVFGGVVTDFWGWRWAFIVQIPFLFCALLIVYLYAVDTSSFSTGETTSFLTAANQSTPAVARSASTDSAELSDEGETVPLVVIPTKTDPLMSLFRRVDYLGSFTLVVSLCLSQLGLSLGGNILAWDEPVVWYLIGVGSIFFLIFAYVERYKAKEPIIPVRLMRRPAVLYSLVVPTMSAAGYLCLLFFLPLYFRARGFSNTVAGLFMISATVGAPLGAIFTGAYMRRTSLCRSLMIYTTTIQTCSMLTMCFTFSKTASVPFCLALLWINAFAFVATLTASTVSIVAAVSQKHQASISSASFGSRSIGSTVGIAVSSAVFQNFLRRYLYDRFSSFPDSEHIIQVIREVGLDALPTIPQSWQDGVLEVYIDTLSIVWITGVFFGLLAIFFSTKLPEIYLDPQQRHMNFRDGDEED